MCNQNVIAIVVVNDKKKKINFVINSQKHERFIEALDFIILIKEYWQFYIKYI